MLKHQERKKEAAVGSRQERTGRKDTWDSQGEELTAMKQPRSLEVSTTIKNREMYAIGSNPQQSGN